MKRKIIKLLARIRRSKFFKIFFSCFLLLTVFLSSFVIPSFAEDYTVLTGYRIIVGGSFEEIYPGMDLVYVTSGTSGYSFDFVSMDTDFIGLAVVDPDFVGPQMFSGITVYSGGSWVDQDYSLISITNQTVLTFVADFVSSISIPYRPTEFVYGVRLFNSALDLSLPGFNDGTLSFNGLEYVSAGTGYFTVPFVSNNTDYLGLNFIDTSFVGPDTVSGITVYQASVGWVDNIYRRVDFGDGYAVDLNIANWIYDNSVAVEDGSFDDAYYLGYNDGFNQGFDLGYDEGFTDGEIDGYYDGFYIGYDSGLYDGLNSTDSGNLGVNLIGSTLSAPFRALDNFILFTTPGGVDISLGFIFGGIISLIIFLAFLKLFAGG